ncbi:MAG: hypothetical protein GX605_07955 [Chloroflexi bacterium]|nr:hypothetical protein [Chloroflexota bacterium]
MQLDRRGNSSEGPTPTAQTPKAGKWALGILGLLALLSVVSIGVTVANYIEGTQAASHIRLRLSDLRVHEGTAPQMTVTYEVSNNSALQFRLQDLHFSIYLNGNFMGSNYTPFYELVLGPNQTETMEFVIPLRPFYLQHLERARAEDKFSWYARGRFRLLLPYRDRELWLNIREYKEGLGE